VQKLGQNTVRNQIWSERLG